MNPAIDSSPAAPRRLLEEHGRAVERGCDALLAATYRDDRLELVADFRRFERAALDHLAAEETEILPAYASAVPDDAEAIRADHAWIRRQLSELAIEVELHVIRADTIERLTAALRAHAVRENASMYPWTEKHLSPEARKRVSAQIESSLRELRQLGWSTVNRQ